MSNAEVIGLLAAAPALVAVVLIALTYVRVRRIGDQVAKLYRDLEGNGYPPPR